jgi:hypothetical protein
MHSKSNPKNFRSNRNKSKQLTLTTEINFALVTNFSVTGVPIGGSEVNLLASVSLYSYIHNLVTEDSLINQLAKLIDTSFSKMSIWHTQCISASKMKDAFGVHPFARAKGSSHIYLEELHL